jgi:hypothetical protein
MKRPASLVSAVVFWLIALAQLLRVLLRVRVTAGSYDIPLWLSYRPSSSSGLWGSGCGANGRSSTMSYNIVERMVRQRLREKNGQVYCADCLAKDLEQDPREVRAAMDVLAPRHNFSAGSCPCGQTGLMLR